MPPKLPPSALSKPELAAAQRLNQLTRYNELRAGGLSATKAAIECGASVPTLWRYQTMLDSGGLKALEPKTGRCGRKAFAEGIGLTTALVKQLQALCLAEGSVHRGFKLFAQLPQCSPRLARVVHQAKSIPPSLRKLVALQPVKFTGFQVGERTFLRQVKVCSGRKARQTPKP